VAPGHAACGHVVGHALGVFYLPYFPSVFCGDELFFISPFFFLSPPFPQSLAVARRDISTMSPRHVAPGHVHLFFSYTVPSFVPKGMSFF